MGRILSKSRVYDALTVLGLLCAVSALIKFPRESTEAAAKGVKLCFEVLIPSLFPFFVVSTLAVRLGVTEKLTRIFEPVMRPLFGVSGVCSGAMIMGFLGGYPVGARTAIALYENGECSKTDAERMLAWCNNSGPAFILGAVGAGVFASGSAGLLLFFVHILSSLAVGVLFRGFGKERISPKAQIKKRENSRESFPAAFIGAVSSSFSAVLGLCGFVIFFTVIIRLLFLSGLIPAAAGLLARVLSPFGIDRELAERLLTGMIELSSGVTSLSGAAAELPVSMAMAAFMLGWAGLSVHCQVLSFLASSGLRFRGYILGKLCHGVISAALVFILSKLFFRETAVSAVLAGQVSSNVSSGFIRNATIACAAILALGALLFALGEKHSSKSGKKGV